MAKLDPSERRGFVCEDGPRALTREVVVAAWAAPQETLVRNIWGFCSGRTELRPRCLTRGKCFLSMVALATAAMHCGAHGDTPFYLKGKFKSISNTELCLDFSGCNPAAWLSGCVDFFPVDLRFLLQGST